MAEFRDNLDRVPTRPSRWERVKEWAKRDSRLPDWLIILLTGGIVFTSLLQWREIKAGSKDTHALAEAAKTQSEKMSNMSDAADKIRRAAQDMVVQDQRIADNAKASLDASNKRSRDALDASVAASRLDERPWLVPSGFRLSEEPGLDTGVTVTVFVVNTGKTPALELVNQSKLFLLNVDPPGPNFDLPVNPRSRAIVAPGATAAVQFKTDPLILKTLREMSFYTSLSYRIYLEALVRYKDTFNQDHWTTVCAYHVSGAALDYFQYCEHGNEVDEERGKKAN